MRENYETSENRELALRTNANMNKSIKNEIKI